MQPNFAQLQPIPTKPDPVSVVAQQIATSKPTPSFSVPANHVLPNLSTSIFPTTRWSLPNVAKSQSAPQGLTKASNTNSDNNATVSQVAPLTRVGIVYYLNASSRLNILGGAIPSNLSLAAPMTIGGPKLVPAGSVATPQTEPKAFMVQDLAQLLASSVNDHLPEWKLAQNNANFLQWNEWFGHFKSAINSAPLSVDVKLTYLKTLVNEWQRHWLQSLLTAELC